MHEAKIRLAREIVETEPDEALRICNEILNEDMTDKYGQMALFMSGYIMMQAERFGLAYNIYQRCSQLNSEQSEIWSNMGMCLEDTDEDQAIECFDKAFALNNTNYRALANKALILLHKGQPKKCIELCEQALQINPELVVAKHNRGLARLMLRQWRGGWTDYADTLGVKHREARDYGVPDWKGQPGTVLIYGEQGVGDEIMFASCLPDVMKTNRVVLDADSRLEGLFRRTFDCPVYGTRFKTETPLLDEQHVDYQCAIGQLPSIYRLNGEYPGTPYLKVDPERKLQWQALFDTFKGKKIGIAWRGGLRNTGERKRSMALDDLKPLIDKRNTYISLEYKEVEQSLLDKYEIRSYPRATRKGGDIDDLAALVSCLDYVITPCTTNVYIAGAQGIPCYVLVPNEPGYRYHIEGDFPWYNSVKLIRQHKGELWSRVAWRASNLIKMKRKKVA